MTSPHLSPLASADPSGAQTAPPETATAASTSSSKSGGCAKGCLGCGCLSVVVAFIAVLGLGGMVIIQGPTTVGADSWGEAGETLTRMANVGSALEGGGDPSSALGDAAGTDADAQDQGAQQMNQIFDRLEDTELDARDISTIKQRIEDWESVDQVIRFNDTLGAIQALDEGDSESVIQNLRSLRHFYQLFFRAGDLGDAYSDHFGQLSPEDRAKQQQLTIIARTARVGTSGDAELWEQAVADELLEFHDEHRQDYEQARELFMKSQEPGFDPEEDLSAEEQRRLQEAMGDQFILLASAINRSSLEAWAALSDDERREFIETLDKPENLVPRIIGAIVSGADEDDDGAELIHLMFLGA